MKTICSILMILIAGINGLSQQTEIARSGDAWGSYDKSANSWKLCTKQMTQALCLSGVNWALSMVDIYPERMAIVAGSPAFDPQFAYSEAATKVPLLVRHAGPKDFNDPGLDCWGTALNTLSGTSSKKVKHIGLKKIKSADVGNPSLLGRTEVNNDHISVVAGGEDIWGKKDEFTFAYLKQTGDFDIVARVESLTAPHLYTKAGIMARETLMEGSRHIYFQVFPDNRSRNKNNGGYEFQYREATNGDMKAVYPALATGEPEFLVSYPNTWIRLKRSGSQFSGYHSSDGKMWKLYTSFSLDLPLKVYLGLAVTSHNTSEKATGIFKDIGFVK